MTRNDLLDFIRDNEGRLLRGCRAVLGKSDVNRATDAEFITYAAKWDADIRRLIAWARVKIATGDYVGPAEH